MIQRVQTIYMLASVIAILTMHFFSLVTYALPEATLELNSLGLVCLTPDFAKDQMCWDLFLLLLVMVALPLITIFLYKKRKIQLHMLIYTAILDVCYYGLSFWKVCRGCAVCHHTSSLCPSFVHGCLPLSPVPEERPEEQLATCQIRYGHVTRRAWMPGAGMSLPAPCGHK